MQVFLLGIESRQERMATTMERLRAKGFRPEPFFGVDGAQPTAHDKVLATAGAWGEMTIGQLCCAQSHLNLFREVLDRSLDYAVVCEDDALPLIGAGHLEERLKDLPKGWHIALLLENTLCEGVIHPDGSLHTGFFHRMQELSYGAWAYAISKEGADYFLNESLPIFTPIDCMFRFRAAWINAYQSKSNWFGHDQSLNSAIHGMDEPIPVHDLVRTRIQKVDFICPSPANHLRVIIPFRNRHEHIPTLVRSLTETLSAQNTPFKVTIVEQHGDDLFNRGKLCNVGFHLHQNDDAWFAMHDVDLVPESPNCDYSKPTFPTHLSVYNSQANFSQTYEGAMGGVTLWPKEWFSLVNGFSNLYRGWGLEDDDLRKRLELSGVPTLRRYGRFRSLYHAPKTEKKFTGSPEERAELVREVSPYWLDNYRRLEEFYDYTREGLNTLAYNVVRRVEYLGCEIVTVEV